ncbi:RNA-binding S4 domain-containing protein [Acetohalobium arabaticum]|uniref:RNA-binding S4 domain protein n=1 Tax=Acetohalobium arabaticum (strain ATCC 49924 / DSM 5501 / Z-7288) TaxID=574087 RepID=D9QS99_ACEAZ|nr:RNA-binding S4 domain-containing protein [Acetohalobium arabaticum]ADL11555.1 RNA-binding S4 domain protein [Acetohalobium arabaticum DSM 5501]
MREIKIKTKDINLNQFLKWANIVSTGGEAKLLIKKGKVMVNGEVEKRRGFTLHPGDVIKIDNEEYKVIT